MINKRQLATKDKILETAARMFSERGYDKVTTREIANAIGINSASIYYHFPSKEDILRSLYELYTVQLRKASPDLGELLRLAETAPPREVLMKSEFHFDGDIRGLMDQILVTAARRIVHDKESERFIQENIFGPIQHILKPLLEHMVKLEKIKPFDLDHFILVLSFFGFSAAALNNSIFSLNVAQYQAVMSYLFARLEPENQ